MSDVFQSLGMTGEQQTGQKQNTEFPVGESPKQIVDIANILDLQFGCGSRILAFAINYLRVFDEGVIPILCLIYTEAIVLVGFKKFWR
ncbi:hypothetical protein B0T20DRAFT_482168 [Sordaria brevicollis]|uniref:Uncharacterized protein n=1 Tax=Sordaria brevicollis TaxID=83679 RepID=A0AAE0PA23_SORBR|nr:hypothetical protein B0T20DRAFT_482168 [Sordaria brevicollis]